MRTVTSTAFFCQEATEFASNSFTKQITARNLARLDEVRMVILGHGAVGKTSMTRSFLKRDFLPHYNPTIEDTYEAMVRVDGHPVTLEILDTAGQEQYETLRDSVLGDGEVFLIVYAINDRESFAAVRSLYQAVVESCGRDRWDQSAVPMMLLANKADLTNQRVVSYEEGKQLAQELGNLPFAECSAKTRQNIHRVFEGVARQRYVRLLRLTGQTRAHAENAGSSQACVIL
eukprot:comp7038_c0_seq1/m.2777 comp7038_c0_seq1/g.2777  ORF comp7038_c0_seq1/g.2777 comp7038_c0_seq1/m.2777 type:complete len:231 (-) comp7038_c0_seq1:463-1155(-)